MINGQDKQQLMQRGKTTWYRVPAVLLFWSPLIPPLYVSRPPDNTANTLFFALTIFGCICSFTWFIKTESRLAKFGIGLLGAWYLLFSILILYRVVRLGL